MLVVFVTPNWTDPAIGYVLHVVCVCVCALQCHAVDQRCAPLAPVDGGRETVTPSKRADTGMRPSLTFRQTQALQLAKKYCQDVTMKAVSPLPRGPMPCCGNV